MVIVSLHSNKNSKDSSTRDWGIGVVGLDHAFVGKYMDLGAVG